MGIVAGWAYDKSDTIWFAFGLTFAISVLGFFFCSWWRAQVESYKDLNTAKFGVLNEMASNVVFPGYGDKAVRSAEPFDREWKILLQRKQLRPYRKGVFALKATGSEMTVPISFQVFFVLTAVLSFAVEWLRYGESIRRLLQQLI